tara:strand:- start:254 stop:394 length:141 start_codon:yes stop_codon:yes gene_type:complete
MIFDEVILDDLDDELTTPVFSLQKIICTNKTSAKSLQLTHTTKEKI